VLYECATGLLPFRTHGSVSELLNQIARGGAPRSSSLVPAIPAAFDAVLARAMSLDPADRFPSVLDLGRALLPFASARARALWSDEFGQAPASRRHTSRPGFELNAVPLSPAELRALPVFARLPDDELARLSTLAPGLRFASGAALFDQGARAASCFVVVSGEIELSRTHGAETWVIDTVGPGAVLGLGALWEEGVRPVSALARSAGVVMEIRRDALEKLGAECPAVADRLHEEASGLVVRRLRGARDRVSDLLDRPGADASREALVRLVAAIGEWSVKLPRRPR
jgi:CRP-like cAMP-binding protein